MKKIVKHVFKSYANVEALGKVISWNAWSCQMRLV